MPMQSLRRRVQAWKVRGSIAVFIQSSIRPFDYLHFTPRWGIYNSSTLAYLLICFILFYLWRRIQQVEIAVHPLQNPALYSASSQACRRCKTVCFFCAPTQSTRTTTIIGRSQRHI